MYLPLLCSLRGKNSWENLLRQPEELEDNFFLLWYSIDWATDYCVGFLIVWQERIFIVWAIESKPAFSKFIRRVCQKHEHSSLCVTSSQHKCFFGTSHCKKNQSHLLKQLWMLKCWITCVCQCSEDVTTHLPQ